MSVSRDMTDAGAVGRGPHAICRSRYVGQAHHFDGLRSVGLSFRYVHELFDASNPVLAHCFARGSKLLVVTDEEPGEFVERLHTYFSTYVHSGQLDGYDIVTAQEDKDGTPVDACLRIAEAAIRLGFKRKDSFLSVAGPPVTDRVGVAAALFRRSARHVRVHCTVEGIVHSVRRGPRSIIPHVDGYLGLTQRQTLCLVDATKYETSSADATETAWLATAADIGLLNLARLTVTQPSQCASALVTRDLLWMAFMAVYPSSYPGAPLPSHAWPYGTIAPWSNDDGAGLVDASPGMAAILKFLDALSFNESERQNATVRWLCWLEPKTVGNVVKISPPLDQSMFPPRHLSTLTPRDLRTALLEICMALLETDGAINHTSTSIAISGKPETRAQETIAESKVIVVEQLKYSVVSTARILDLANQQLASICEGRRVLAVVDGYPGNHAAELRAYLNHYRATGRILAASVVICSISPIQKTMGAVLELIAQSQEQGADMLLAMGGGTLMDVVGFAAALHNGGTQWIRIPTTLVGMIDAGVGLKVGVNFAQKKNFAGSYYPSDYCLNERAFLRTLPIEESRCGISEAIKMAIVKDARLFRLIETHYRDVFEHIESSESMEIIDRSVSTMLEELESNPYEDNLRRLPDFGHEFGHMIEGLTNFQLRHGEAVAVGMALSSHLAYLKGRFACQELHRVLDLLLTVGLPIHHACCDPEVLWDQLKEVLSHKGGKLHLVIPEYIGRGGFIDEIDEISPQLLSETCQALASYAQRVGAERSAFGNPLKETYSPARSRTDP